jgi:DNA segregation ATPase FtsK/SpoIIIE-like protein
LSARSDYFFAMLHSTFRESTSAVVDLPGRDRFEIEEIFLPWVYTGEIVQEKVTPDVAIQTLGVATEFCAFSLVSALCAVIVDAIDEESAPFVLYLGEQLHLPVLTRAATEYVLRYSSAVRAGDGFREYETQCDFFQSDRWRDTSDTVLDEQRTALALRKQANGAADADRRARRARNEANRRAEKADADAARVDARKREERLAESHRQMEEARKLSAAYRERSRAQIQRAAKANTMTRAPPGSVAAPAEFERRHAEFLASETRKREARQRLKPAAPGLKEHADTKENRPQVEAVSRMPWRSLAVLLVLFAVLLWSLVF